MILMTTHSLHLKQATAGLIRMIMSTLLSWNLREVPIWKLGQENHVGGTCFFFFSAILRCIAVDARRGLCVIVSSSREVSR